MSDLIDKQALLEEIENGIRAGNLEEGYERYPNINTMDDIIETIRYADVVQPERKTGRWILIEKASGFPDWICSECGGSGRGDYLFCPWCQAKMESKQTLSEVDNDTAYGGLMSAT